MGPRKPLKRPQARGLIAGLTDAQHVIMDVAYDADYLRAFIAHDLGATVLEAVVERAGVAKEEVSETILGQVLTAAQGQNPARQAHINAGLPKESAAWGINQVCGSGLRAVALAAQHIKLGDADIVAAGGQENMSLSTHAAHLRAGHKMGDL